jgi:hypothetical protein
VKPDTVRRSPEPIRKTGKVDRAFPTGVYVYGSPAAAAVIARRP